MKTMPTFCRMAAAALLLLLFNTLAFGQTAQEGVKVVPDPEKAGGRLFTTAGVTGRLYFGQMSTDGISWSYLSPVKLGSTGSQVYFGFVPTAGTRCFFRMRYTLGTTFTLAASDQDLDGLSDQDEVTTWHTDPFLMDTDGDQMPDGWEAQYNLNPLTSDAALDPDGDTLTNLQEYLAGTKPTGAGTTSRDSDKDGLADNVELAAGGNPAKFDMPTFTVLSSWRKVVVQDSLQRSGGSTVRDVSATGSWDGTSGGSQSRTWDSTGSPAFPYVLSNAGNNVWNGSPAFSIDPGTMPPTAAHDMKLPLYGCYQVRMHGTGGFINTNVSFPNTEESRDIERHGVLMERTIRIMASRKMPVSWSIPYLRWTSTITGRKTNWSTPASTAGTFSFAVNDQYSPSITLTGTTVGSPGCLTPGRARASAGAAWTETAATSCGAIEWITFDKLAALPATTGDQGDPDKDGLTTAFERDYLQTNPNSADSDGRGYNDGDQLNAGVMPPTEGYLIANRTVDYAFAPTDPKCPYHPGNRLGVIRDTPASSALMEPLQSATGYGVDDSLQSAIVTQGAFNSTPPDTAALPQLDDEGYARPPSTPSAEMSYSSFTDGNGSSNQLAEGNQQRVWAMLDEAPAADITLNYGIIQTVANAGSQPVTTLINQPMNFKAGSRRSSNYMDLLAKHPAGAPSTSGVQNQGVHPVITPAANMAGVVGDIIKSSTASSTVRHFVTPKKTTQLPQNEVEFTATSLPANYTAAQFSSLFEWTTSEPSVTTISGLSCKVKRDAALGPVILKIQKKGTPSIVYSEVHVWIVWCDWSPLQVVIPPALRTLSTNQGAYYSFILESITTKATIQPTAIITNSEHPALEGAPQSNPPGVGLIHLNDGIKISRPKYKWDISRQYRCKIIANVFDKNWMLNYTQQPASGIYSKVPSPISTTVVVDYPQSNLEGNDDSEKETTQAGVYGENSNPYDTLPTGLANIGELFDSDAPGHPAAFNAPPPIGSSVEVRMQFREFCRLELAGKWYRLSEDQLWRHHGALVKDPQDRDGDGAIRQHEYFDGIFPQISTGNDGW